MPLSKLIKGERVSVHLRCEMPESDFWKDENYERFFFQFQTRRSSSNRFEAGPDVQDRLVEFLNNEVTGAFYVDHETTGLGDSKYLVYLADANDFTNFMERFVAGEGTFDYVHDALTVNEQIDFEHLRDGHEFRDARLRDKFSGLRAKIPDVYSDKAAIAYALCMGRHFDI